MQFYQKLLEVILPGKNILNIKNLQEDYTPFIKKPFYNSLEFIWVASEYTPDIKKIINRAKTQGCYDLITPLIDNLILQIANDTLCKDPVSQELFTLQDIWPSIISFVPADPYRNRIRGYHLPIIIAKKLAKTLRSSYIPLAKKQKTTQSQSELSRVIRLTNLEGKFELIDSGIKEARSYIDPIVWLIDDVSTTGSTLIEVASSIKKQLPDSLIYGIVLSGGSDD